MLDLTKTYITRGGRAVSGLQLRPHPGHLFSDAARYPIVGIIQTHTGEFHASWTADGHYLSTGEKTDNDLIQNILDLTPGPLTVIPRRYTLDFDEISARMFLIALENNSDAVAHDLRETWKLP